MTSHEHTHPRTTLGRNATAAAKALAESRGIDPAKIWIALAHEHWPDDHAPERSRSLRQIAAGKRWPQPETLAKLAAALEVDLEQLFRAGRTRVRGLP